MMRRCMDCHRLIWPWQRWGQWIGLPPKPKVYRWHWKCEVVR